MRLRRKMGYGLFAAGALLVLYGYVHTGGEAPAAEPPERGVSIAASFRREDGGPLRESTVRLSTEDGSADYPLDGGGSLAVSGLSRSGKLTLTVLDSQDRIQGTVDLTFSEGAVIDAAMDGSGAGHIMLKRDTGEITLAFLLKNDGSILCALRLDQPEDSGLR